MLVIIMVLYNGINETSIQQIANCVYQISDDESTESANYFRNHACTICTRSATGLIKFPPLRRTLRLLIVLLESECDSGLSLSPPHVKPVDTRAAVRVRTSVGVSSSRSARVCSPFLSDFVCVMFFALSQVCRRYDYACAQTSILPVVACSHLCHDDS